jgi:hypothetical protein
MGEGISLHYLDLKTQMISRTDIIKRKKDSDQMLK